MSMIQIFKEWQKNQTTYIILAVIMGYQYGYTDSRFYLFVIAWVISLITSQLYLYMCGKFFSIDFNKDNLYKVVIQAITLVASYLGMRNWF